MTAARSAFAAGVFAFILRLSASCRTASRWQHRHSSVAYRRVAANASAFRRQPPLTFNLPAADARTMSETKLREDICRFGRSLFERGLTPGSSGNISVRLDDGGWLVTPTNASLGFLDPAKLSRLSADGKLIAGDAPTKEVPLHSALYQTRQAA